MNSIFNEIKEEQITTIENLTKVFKPCEIKNVSFISKEKEIVHYYFESNISIDVGEHTLINNCVFAGDVTITMNNNESSIEISNCIFKKKLRVQHFGNEKNATTVDINRCNIEQLFFYYKIMKLTIAYSTVNILQMLCKSEHVNLFNNVFNQFLPNEGITEKGDITFWYNDFKFLTQDYINKKIKLLENPGIILDKNINSKENEEIAYSHLYEELIKHSNFKYNRNKYAKYLYKCRLYSSSNVAGKVFIIVTGGFCKPFLFLLYSLIILIVFGGLYYLIEDTVTFMHSLYYSGITFTTLGYTELKEYTHQLVKLLSVIEGFLGVILASCFLTSIVNKYSN